MYVKKFFEKMHGNDPVDTPKLPFHYCKQKRFELNKNRPSF